MSAAMGFFPEGLKNEFEIAVVNEPSVFEPLKFYCTIIILDAAVCSIFLQNLLCNMGIFLSFSAHLLLHQNRMASSTVQGDNDLLNVLNALRQSMEEVRDILSKLKPLLVSC